MKNQKIETMDLLNSEGGILKMYKKVNGILLKDQYKKNIREFTISEIVDYTQGKFDITDSAGKVWNFPSQSEGMRPKPKALSEFLGVEITY